MSDTIKKIWNRKGIIRMTLDFIKEITIEDMKVIFDGIFIIDTENRLYDSSVKYFAISPLFKEMREEDSAPEYQATVERLENGKIKVEWKVL